MKNDTFVMFLAYLEPIAYLFALCIMSYRKILRQYAFVAMYLLLRLTSVILMFAVFRFGGRHLSHLAVYRIYFYLYWSSYGLEAGLGFGIILSIYKVAMAPLHGLQRLGMLMFRWAAGISVAIAGTMAFGPRVTSQGFIKHAVTQLQETESVLTLCMLLFVCLAIRPMGLSHRSKIFGVSLGLGILAISDLVQAAWLPHLKQLITLYNTINGLAIFATLCVWTAYFAIPEPKRRMIILPTTSPFLRWNQISIALGDEPGFVALGDVTPDMFAPAEVEIMRRASLKMRLPIAN